jgi:HSP20 family protein
MDSEKEADLMEVSLGMLLSDPFTPMFSAFGRPGAFLPAADVTVSEGDVVLTMDLPGLTPEDLDIQFLDGYLVVRGERRRPQVADGVTWMHSERTFGSFERRIRLPEGVDADRIAATMVNGVLSLIVPKPERLKPRQITIDSHGEQRELETASA